MKKRIIVTGGVGYIGDFIVQELLCRDCDVAVIDNLIYGGSYLRGLGDDRLSFYKLDIMDEWELESAIKEFSPDVIIHLAAIVGDAACQIDSERTVKVNEDAAIWLADYCWSKGVKFIFASTCSVYGANNKLLDEKSETNPLSLYAGTKLNAEKFIQENLDDYIIFRLGTVFGISSEHARIRSDLVANALTFKVCEGQDITVFGGEQWRPLIHVKDVGWAFVDAALKDIESGIYILSAYNMKIMDLAEQIWKINPRVELITTKAKFEDLRNYKVDNSKALNNGFQPIITFKMGIEEMADIVNEGRIANIWSPEFNNAKYIGANYGNS